ncbi:superoxide dismutase family protein [Vallicoccus soli]|uniref:Superoxide dismutase [Cu-Zn] n=1 Tax=Vallicoccus soli TaxID=2339232 RepID=A0A3A3YZN1_9ACTN|nr:superoxide dismutase family protein [Vallicoccus soli]RJK96343.1 superoxide dismutase family protein [Vallicoccus soli]
MEHAHEDRGTRHGPHEQGTPRRGLPTRWMAVGLAAAAAATATAVVTGGSAQAERPDARTTLRLADGRAVGTVAFYDDPRLQRTQVRVSLDLPRGVTPLNAFHGFHVHANGDGAGCVADPSAPSSTWFTAVGGHYARPGQPHAYHAGDMPSLLVNRDGTVSMTFTTARFSPEQLEGRAVILHDDEDNFGNVPVGSGADEYRPGPDALAVTRSTGNAGDRIACGVVRR